MYFKAMFMAVLLAAALLDGENQQASTSSAAAALLLLHAASMRLSMHARSMHAVPSEYILILNSNASAGGRRPSSCSNSCWPCWQSTCCRTPQ
jgi:hypothetical protein